MRRLPFNNPHSVGQELEYISRAMADMHLSGNGSFTKRCQAWLEEQTGARKALLTHSCTGALEMAAILANIEPGDEVIMPSFTFVSTANAFVLRGAVPVFVDVCPDTLNLDPALIEAAITPRTRAITVVHYAGVSCDMAAIGEIARRHSLLVIEDAAQGLLSMYRGQPLGTIGDFGALSFHETKNVISGEGGALLLRDNAFAERAEIIWEKGTNRGQFFRGQVDKYTWVDVGSSFLPSEVVAAFLWAQIEEAEAITRERLAIWHAYHERLAGLEVRGLLRRPIVPADCVHNGHLYYILLPDLATRTALIDVLRSEQVFPVFHYVPLHSSPAGRRYGRAVGELPVTDMAGDRLLRMPLWIGMTPEDVERIVSVIAATLDTRRAPALEPIGR